MISTIKYQIIAIINHVPSVNDPNEVLMLPSVTMVTRKHNFFCECLFTAR